MLGERRELADEERVEPGDERHALQRVEIRGQGLGGGAPHDGALAQNRRTLRRTGGEEGLDLGGGDPRRIDVLPRRLRGDGEERDAPVVEGGGDRTLEEPEETCGVRFRRRRSRPRPAGVRASSSKRSRSRSASGWRASS